MNIMTKRQDIEDAFRSLVRVALASLNSNEKQVCLQYFIDILVDMQEKSE